MTTAVSTRRHFMHIAGAAGLVSAVPALAAGEPPPETNRIRLQDAPVACFAPLYVAEAF